MNGFACLFLAALGLRYRVGFSLAPATGAPLHGGAWAPHCAGFSCCETQALGSWASIVTRAPEHRFSGYGPWAALLRGMQGLLAQRSNPCPSHWQVDSLPLSLQGSPCLHLYDKLWAEFSNKQRTHWSSPPGSVLLQDTVFLFAFPILVHIVGYLKNDP